MEPPSRKFYPVETEKNPKGDFIIKIPGVSGNPGQKWATPRTPGCTARPQLPSGEEREGREFLKNLKSWPSFKTESHYIQFLQTRQEGALI